MQIFARYQGVEAVELTDGDVVFGLKQKLEQLYQIPAEELVLFCSGRPLEDEELVANCLHHGDHVDVNVRLVGGKVHGSLARAGKVKGQTPKVEKQEKKKKATGRAKRRNQYNRRFANTVRAPGRKRGPNSNAQ